MFGAIFLSYPCMLVLSFIILPRFEGTFIEKIFENTAVSVMVSYLLGLACAYFIYYASYTGGGSGVPEGPSRHVGPFEY